MEKLRQDLLAQGKKNNTGIMLAVVAEPSGQSVVLNKKEVASFRVEGELYLVAEDLPEEAFALNWSQDKTQLQIKTCGEVSAHVSETDGGRRAALYETSLTATVNGRVTRAYNMGGKTLVSAKEFSLSDIADKGIKGNRTCALDTAILEGKGQWYPIICMNMNGCGGSCSNMAYMVDGVFVRQKTDDISPETDENFQQRGCPRGRSQQQVVFGADRLKYPMKRKHWQPGGGENAHGELRGRDEWERISWEEALDLTARELKRIYESHGPESVLATIKFEPEITNLLAMMGGYLSIDDTVSFGSWSGYSFGIGVPWHDQTTSINDRFDILNADYISMTGSNNVWAAPGTSVYLFQKAKEAGVKFVHVGASYNLTASALDAKWIRVRTATDTAFLLAVAYEMLRLDKEEGNIIDWEFLDRYTVGFDMEHLPADAKLQECFKDYVLGKYDGIPKTPEWATEICGTPVEDITWYARMCAKTNNVMLLHAYAATRCNGTENMPQAFLTVGCMGGHIGKPGNATGTSYNGNAVNGGPSLVSLGEGRRNDVPNPIKRQVYGVSMWKSMVEGKYTWYGPGKAADTPFMKGEEHDLDVKLIYVARRNLLQATNDMMNGIKAYRKADFCVCHDVWPSMTAMYSDIVFPIVSRWEGNYEPEKGDLIWPVNRAMGGKNRELLLAQYGFIQPMYECKSDRYVTVELAKRLGLPIEEVYPVNEVQYYFDCMANSTVREEDGTLSKLFTLRQETLDQYHVDNKPQTGKIDYEDFIRQGFYLLERSKKDEHAYCGYQEFIRDPQANPLRTTSGKFEIYCQKKADCLNNTDFSKDEEDIKPYANYFVSNAGYEKTFADWEKKIKGPYPYQMYNPHYLRRCHTQDDNLPWLQEAFENPVFLNASDAEEKGIQNGDTVVIWNEHGRILRHASLLQTLMPGTVAVPHGAHSDIDEDDPEGPIDRGGNPNMLCASGPSNYSPALSGYNTTLVNFAKYDGKPICKDHERTPFMIEEG